MPDGLPDLYSWHFTCSNPGLSQQNAVVLPFSRAYVIQKNVSFGFQFARWIPGLMLHVRVYGPDVVQKCTDCEVMNMYSSLIAVHQTQHVMNNVHWCSKMYVLAVEAYKFNMYPVMHVQIDVSRPILDNCYRWKQRRQLRACHTNVWCTNIRCLAHTCTRSCDRFTFLIPYVQSHAQQRQTYA